MRPSEVFEKNRQVIRDAAARRKTINPRVFGSVLHGSDHEGSDIDILVDVFPDTTLFDLGGLQEELSEKLGVPVQILTPEDLHPFFRDRVIDEARAV